MKTFFFIIIGTVFFHCNNPEYSLIKLAGEAQGTTWHITYLSKAQVNYKNEIDSILKDIDQSLSTYVPSSIISRINKNDSNVTVDKYFKDVFTKAVEVSEKTGGLFDVTVAPIINAWGFGFTRKALVNKHMIDSLLGDVGYKMVRLQMNKVIKTKPGVMLDFNAIAQGYSIDVLASFLDARGVKDYIVELGGEVKAKGKKSRNEFWKIGVDQPNEVATDDRPLEAVIQLQNKALATSGNYRKFYVENGEKHSHIINPVTGYPEKHTLLSATVIAEDCMTADAYATAFMVMGVDQSKQFLQKNAGLGLEVFFIFNEKETLKTYTSETLKGLLVPVR